MVKTESSDLKFALKYKVNVSFQQYQCQSEN